MEQGGLAKGIAVMTTWLALGSMVVPAIHAADFKTGEQVTVDAGQTIDDDLYMTGDTLTVLGIVDGDVVASARIIRIEGTVLGDLIAAGQVISIGGEVRDDVRIGGMTLKLEEDAVIGDDVFAAGFSFESAPGSRVQGKTHLSGYQGSLEGEHQQGLEASLVGLRISGTVLGGVEASVRSQSGPAWWVRFMQSPIPLPSVEPGLEITSQATIGGDLSYRSVAEASIGEGAQLGGKVVHEAREAADEPKDSPGAKLGRAGRWILVLFLFGAALLWLVPDKLLGMTSTLDARPAAALGWGLVTLIGTPVVMILVLVLTLALTMVFGLMTLDKAVSLVLLAGVMTLLVLTLVLWIILSYLAPVLAALVGGRRLLTRGKPGLTGRYASLLAGLAILALLGLIPFVGGAVRSLVGLVGLGAVALWSVRHLARSQRDLKSGAAGEQGVSAD